MRAQSSCIAQLNHLLNRGKLTSITNNINSFSAPRGILLLGVQGLNVGLPTIIKQTSSPGPSPARVYSTCRAVVWKDSAAEDIIACNKFCNKVKVELARCCGGAAGGNQSLSGKATFRHSLFFSTNIKCRVSRWSWVVSLSH